MFLGRAHLYAPGTGTPEIGGFTSRGVQKFVRDLTDLEIVGCDVVEVYPAYDHAQITALLAANVAHESSACSRSRKSRYVSPGGIAREPTTGILE